MPISGEWVDGREHELWGLRPRPPEGTWPQLMSPVHPDAVGTYGPEMLAWAQARPGMHPKRSSGQRWWQELVAHRVLEHDADGRLLHRVVVITTSRQVGKALAADTPVLTADRGWSLMGDLAAGDRVLAPDGSPTTVTAAHPVRMPAGGLWRVTLTDGRWLDADGEHLWEVFDRGGARRVMTTLELLDAGLARFRLSDQSSIASMERVPDRMVRCITVDRPDGMFLAGRELVPTHNSWTLRELCGWRLSLAGRLGEVQTVVHAADKLQHAFSVWKWAALWAAQQPALRVRWANGEQKITTPDGSEWGIHAAGEGLGASMSVSLGLVDEGWNVSLDVVDNGLVPTMAEAEQPQLILVSTAGGKDDDSAVPVSPLVPSYRDVALAGGGVLLLDWSAPREADIDDPASWRLASPHWDERRLEVMRAARFRATTAQSVEAFRRQWLNQWPVGVVRREPPLVDALVWEEAARAGVARPSSRLVVGLSCEEAGRWPVVAAGRVGESSAVLVWLVGVADSMDAAVTLAAGVSSGGGGVLLVPSHGLRDQVPRVPGTGSRFHLNEGDAASAMAMVHEWLAGGLLVHDPADEALTGAVLALPERRRARTWDAGMMALVVGWWAHKQRPRASVV